MFSKDATLLGYCAANFGIKFKSDNIEFQISYLFIGNIRPVAKERMPSGGWLPLVIGVLVTVGNFRTCGAEFPYVRNKNSARTRPKLRRCGM